MSNEIEITNRWLMDTAGWAPVKEGKKIHGAGGVLERDYKDGLLKGIVGSGSRKRVAGFRVLGKTDVENLCQCPDARRTGGLCGHSAAVALAWIDRDAKQEIERPKRAVAPEKKLPKNDVTPFGLIFEDRFLQILKSSQKCPVRFDRNASSGWQWPESSNFSNWMAESGISELPPFLVLKPDEIGKFLHATGGHPEVRIGDREASISTVPVRLPMKIEPWGDRGNFSVCLSIPDDGEHHLIKTGSDSYCLYKEATAEFLPVRTPDYPALQQELAPIFDLDPEVWWIEGGAAWLAMNLDFLSDAFRLDVSELPDIPRVAAGTPTFSFKFEGSLNHVAGQLEVRYGEIVFKAGHLQQTRSVSGDFPYIDRDSDWIFRRRNLAAEKAALRQLEIAGFSAPSDAGEIQLSSREKVLQFIASTLPRLRNEWEIVEGERFQHVSRTVEVLRPSFVPVSASDGSSSMTCRLEIASADAVVSEGEVRRLLASGRVEMPLGDSKIGVLDRSAFSEFEEVLRDIEPDQLGNGIYSVQPEQEAYLYQSAAAWQIEELVTEKSRADLSAISDLEDTLRDYQREGIEWMANALSRPGRGAGVLLADDMGLGKTLQALATARIHKAAGGERCLIICPTSLIENWRTEAIRFAPDLSICIMHGPDRSSRAPEMDTADLIITSYALVVRDFDTYYKGVNFGMVVLDEAGYIRNPKTQTAKTVFRLQSDSRIALSGTPIENSLRDLWSIMQFAVPGYLGSYVEFRERYEKVMTGKGASPADSARTGERLKRRLSPYFLRRTKQEVATDLPDRMEKVVFCQPSESQQNDYERIYRDSRKAVQASGNRIEMLAALLRLRQTCCDPRLLPDELRSASSKKAEASGEPSAEVSGKMEALRELLGEALEGGHRVLIFSQFVKMLSLIREELETNATDYCYLDGSSQDRADQVRRFQQGKAPVFLISLKAGGYGLNLTAADTVIHFDPWWNPAVEAQATDRAHRIGQSNPVTSYKLIMRDTVEEKILQLQAKKQDIVDSVVEDFEPVMSGLSESDIREILEI